MPRLPKVLIIYTGGTFGMDSRLRVPSLSPEALRKRFVRRVPELPEIARCSVEIPFNMDSAHLGPSHWVRLAEMVRQGWRDHDGVVILHGTDTLSYTASALSFLLRPCAKPVILTGAQKPLASIRTDARRNLISAVEIAAHGPRSVLRRVGVFFDHRLLQGNRTRKRSAIDFHAFDSPLSAPIAVVGTSIRYAPLSKTARPRPSLKLVPRFSERVAMLHVTPGFPSDAVAQGLLSQVDGLVLSVFLSGTAPTHDPAFIRLLDSAKKRGVPVIAVTDGAAEAPGEAARPPEYAAARALLERGCHWAGGMTPEAAFVKTALILGQPQGAKRFATLWGQDFASEKAGDRG